MTKLRWNFNWAEFQWINGNFSFKVSSYFGHTVFLLVTQAFLIGSYEHQIVKPSWISCFEFNLLWIIMNAFCIVEPTKIIIKTLCSRLIVKNDMNHVTRFDWLHNWIKTANLKMDLKNRRWIKIVVYHGIIINYKANTFSNPHFYQK